MQDDRPEPLLDVRQAAEILGVPRSTLYSWCSGGGVPHFKLGALLRFRRSELERYVEANRRGELSEAKVGAA